MAKIIIPTSDLEAWELLSPTDKLDIARWSHVSQEILEAGLRSKDPDLIEVCKQRLRAENISPARRFQSVAVLPGDAIEIDEPLNNEESTLLARILFRDEYTRRESISSEAELGIPTIIQHPPPSLPADLHRESKQKTAIEVREVRHAVADASAGINWQKDLFGLNYDSSRTKDVELSINDQPYQPLDTAAQTLMDRLSKQAQVVIHIVICALITAEGENIELDVTQAAGLAYGLDSINTAPKAREARAQFWNDVEFGTRIRIRTHRKGKYRVQGRNRRVIDIETDELFRIARYTVLEGDPGDRVRMIVEPRGLIKAYSKNKGILPEFGSLNTTTRIQPGKPSGMIARSLHDTLVQIWREEATWHEIGDNGDNHREVIRYRSFTRRELLLSKRAFRCAFDVADCLDGKDAKRIVKYWKSAIDILKKDGAIGYYLEQGEINLKSRYWRDLWLDQKIEIRPAGDAVKDAIKIAQVAEKNRKALKKAKAQKAGKTRKATHSNQP